MCISGIITAVATVITAAITVYHQIIKERMAIFKVEIETSTPYKGGFCSWIHLKNVGKSDAEDVRIEILPPENEIEKEKFLKFVDRCKWGSYKFYKLINPDSERLEALDCLSISEVPKTLRIKITWKDGLWYTRSKEFSEDLY